MNEITAKDLPNLTKDTLRVLRDVGVGLMTLWEQRGLRKPVLQVSDLSFRAGGMRSALDRIASSKGTAEDIAILEKQLEATEVEVQRTAKELSEGWHQLISKPDGLEIAQEIGEVIHTRVGKMGIRDAIGDICNRPHDDPDTARLARAICDDIDRFNERLIDLHKRVLKPAADIFGKQT